MFLYNRSSGTTYWFGFWLGFCRCRGLSLWFCLFPAFYFRPT